MRSRVRITCLAVVCLGAIFPVAAQMDSQHLVTAGQVDRNGGRFAYRIQHLPVSSFPDLPMVIASELTRRGCLIPQTYEAHRPENVIEGDFESRGSKDWAVLCSSEGSVSLLVFFSSKPDQPATLASARETERLQSSPGADVLGFDWGIDAASPQRVHEAQIGLNPRPERLEHDAVADSVVDRKTVYRYFLNGAWGLVDLPD